MTHQTGEDPAGVQFQQGDSEDLCGGFGGEGLAGSRNANNEQPAYWWQTVIDGALAEGEAPLQEPVLQHVQPADGFQGFLGFNQFQQPVLLHGLGFLPGDDRRLERVDLDDRQREGILGLSRRHPPGGIDQHSTRFRGRRCLLRGLHDAIKDDTEFREPRQGEVDDGELTLQFRW